MGRTRRSVGRIRARAQYKHAHRRVELESLLVRLDGLAVLTDREEGVAETRVGLAERRVNIDRLASIRDGRVVLGNLRVGGGAVVGCMRSAIDPWIQKPPRD